MSAASDPSVPAALTIRREELHADVVVALIAALNAELTALYPEDGATHFRLNPAEVAPGRGAFLVAYDGGRPAGCGAVRLVDADTAEIKRMYVPREGRGRGTGRALLVALEAAARELGARRLVLETGIRQLAAIALYESAGMARIEPFGEYLASPGTSVCMAKEL